MELQVDNLVQKWMDRLSLLMAIAVGVTALTVLAGRPGNISFLRPSQSDQEVMNPAAAFCFVLSVISLLLVKRQQKSASKTAGAYILAGSVLSIGVFTMLNQIPAFPFHADGPLFRDNTTNEGHAEYFQSIPLERKSISRKP
jgi:riboflavin transporter FmnP